MISKDEIVNTLAPINNGYFAINDLNEYANKVIKFGKALVIRNDNSELLSYVLYYDNASNIFISMVWTKAEQSCQGLAKSLILKLLNDEPKEILLEVNENNPAIYLYKNLKFFEEGRNGNNIVMRYSKRLSIMQPYFFPYIGYFHLIEASDKIVFYDDVNFIKRGWINRNRFLLNKTDFLFTIPLSKASQNKSINEIIPLINKQFIEIFLNQIEAAYKKAPYYNEVREIILGVLNSKHSNIADLAINSILAVYSYLGKEINWTKSSVCSPETKGMERGDRLIRITKDLGYKKYMNAIGGNELYDKENFKKQGVQLSFVQSNKIEYQQFNNEFIPWLSIIDILMFNDKKIIKELFATYNIV